MYIGLVMQPITATIVNNKAYLQLAHSNPLPQCEQMTVRLPNSPTVVGGVVMW